MSVTIKSAIKEQLQLTRIIFLALVAGMIILFIVAMVIIQSNQISVDHNLDKMFMYIIPVFGLAVMFLSRFFYNVTLAKLIGYSDLMKKITGYRTTKIISWAIIESACILALLAAMLTYNYLYIAVFIFLFGYFILIRPSKEFLIRDLGLKSEESELILKS